MPLTEWPFNSIRASDTTSITGVLCRQQGKHLNTNKWKIVLERATKQILHTIVLKEFQRIIGKMVHMRQTSRFCTNCQRQALPTDTTCMSDGNAVIN
jgi:hypothetical protein